MPNEPKIIPKSSMILLFGLICLCKKIKAGEGSICISFRTWRWHVPSWNHEPSWENLRFARSLYQSLSQFGQKNYRSMLVPCHDTMPSFMILGVFWIYIIWKTKFLNLSGRAMTPRCLNFIPISSMGPRNSPKDAHVIVQPPLMHWSMCL